MDFSSQFPFAAAHQQPYQPFMPIPPLTPSNGSDDYNNGGNPSPPVSPRPVSLSSAIPTSLKHRTVPVFPTSCP